MLYPVYQLVVLITLLVLSANITEAQNVYYSTDGNYPAVDFSERYLVPGGYKIHSVIDKADVVFPATGWKYISVTFPGGGYVVDPNSAVAFRFHGISFGRKHRQVLLWGYVVSEHQWARKFTSTVISEKDQADFLEEWVQRAMVRREIDHPDELSMIYPALSADKRRALTVLLRLEPADQSLGIKQREVGAYRFSYTELTTTVTIEGQKQSLESAI